MRHLFTALSFLIPYLATGQLYIIVTDIPTETPVEDDNYPPGFITIPEALIHCIVVS
jgi:hypothetical protein